MSRAPHPPPFPPELAARFEVLGGLGAGAMGVVFRVRDRDLEREAAVKILGGETDRAAVERFLREADALAAVNHPNVLRIFDAGRLAGGAPYLVLELLEGRPLSAVEAPPDPLSIVLPIADALAAIHARGLVHRDVKPANLFLTSDGRPVLLDFGLARVEDRTVMTSTGMVVGTPAYLAPEALRGEPPAPALDLYALGVTLFRLLEGREPFTTGEILASVTDGTSRPAPRFARVDPGAPAARLAAAWMHPDPTRRPAGRAQIEAALAGAPRPGGRPPDPAPGDRGATPPAARPASAARGLATKAPPRPAPARSGGAAGPLEEARPPGRPAGPGIKAALFGLAVLGAFLGAGADRSRRADATAPAASDATTRPDPRAVLARAGLEPDAPNDLGFARLRNRVDGTVFLYVPGATFTSRLGFDAAKPGPEVETTLAPFLLAETPVTVGQYGRFLEAVEATRPELDSPKKWGPQTRCPACPVVSMTYREARAYARWAGARLVRGVEWEYAIAGHEKRRYPWGDSPPTDELAHFGKGDALSLAELYRFLSPVGSRPAGRSWIGAHDLVGNAACWTADTFFPPYLRDGPEPGNIGGALTAGPAALSSWFIRTWPPDETGTGLGLRLARGLDDALAAAAAGYSRGDHGPPREVPAVSPRAADAL